MSDTILTDCGHGWVYPRLDRTVAKCGGPALCQVCQGDLFRLVKRWPSTIATLLAKHIAGDAPIEINPAHQPGPPVQQHYVPPWKHAALERWSIVGLNHYAIRPRPGASPERHLFVAMTRHGRCIKAEGPDEDKVWDELVTLAVSDGPG